MAKSGQASVEVMADFAKFASTFQKDLNAALRGVRLDMSGISNQISTGVRDGVNAANDEFRRLGKQAGESFNVITQQASATGKSMAASFSSAGREISSVGDQMTVAISVPVAAAGYATINAAGNFEKAMNKVKAATEASGKEFASLRSLAIELGSTTAFSASEAAYAMNELATAGFDTNEIMGALPGVLDMAAAGSVSLSSAAEIASGILNGFGFAATDLSRVNDILTRDFLSTATTLSDLGESFKYVGPTAKSAGLSFTEVAAAIGLMGNAGIKGSMAGTALNASISRLLKPTKEVENTLNELGVTVTTSSGKLLPLVDIMRQLEQAGANTTDMITLFGLEAGPDMMALLSQGSGALANLDKELQNAGGTAQKVATTQMAGFNGSMDELSSAAEGLMIAIGDAGLLGWVTSLAEKLTELVMKASKLSPTLLQITTVVAVVAAAIGPFLAVFGRMATAIGESIIALKKFGGWVMKIGPWLAGISAPAWLAIAAIVAIGVAAIVAYKKSEAFRNVVNRAFRSVAAAAVWMWQNAIVPAFDWIVANAKVVGAAIARLWQQAQPIFVAWGAAVTRVWNSAVKPALTSIKGSFATAGSAIGDFWASTVQPALTSLIALFVRVAIAVRSWWAGNGDSVIRTAAGVVTWFGGVMTQVWTGIMAVLKGAAAVISWLVVNVAIPMFKMVASVIRTVVTTIMSMKTGWMVAGAVIGAAVMIVIGVVKTLWAVISTVFSAISSIIQWWWRSVVIPAFSAVGVAIQAVVAVVTWLWSNVFQPVFTEIGAIVSWVWTSVIMPVFNAIKTAIGVVAAVVTWLWTTFEPVFTAIGNLVWAVWSGVFSVVFSLLKLAFAVIIGVVQVFWAVIQAAFMAVAAVVMAVWSGVISPVLSAIGALFTWLWSTAIQPAVEAIGALFMWLWSSMISPVINFVSAGLTWLWGVIQTIFNAVVGFIKAAINQIVSAASGVAAFVNSVTAHFQNMVNAVRDKINSVTSFVRGLPGQITSAVGNLASLLYGAGQNVINGLINGISSRIGAIRDKMSEAASAIRDHLPFSPAKVGPLSGSGDPTKAGRKIVTMVSDGMASEIVNINTISSEISGIIAKSFMPKGGDGAALGGTPLTTDTLGAISFPTPTSPGRTGTAGPQNATYQITVSSLDPRTAATLVITAIQDYERRNGKGWRT